MAQLPDGLVSSGPDANCTLALCPVEASILSYQPSIPVSGFFIAAFGVTLIIHLVQGFRGRNWGFAATMACGCALEILGYVGRIFLHDNPFNFNNFLMQLISITVAPVFFCSSIYVLLSQVIEYVDRSISRLPPKLLYWIFIPCDIVSLILQAAGGALSSVGDTSADVQLGVDVSLAGLCFQVFTLVIFCGLFVDYLLAVKSSISKHRVTMRMKIFLVFMFLSILLIFVRCAYRITELKEGYSGTIFHDEKLFIALESVMMLIAVFCLNVAHPSIGLPKKEKRYSSVPRVSKDHMVTSDEEIGMESI